jgi:hypothetical protein
MFIPLKIRNCPTLVRIVSLLRPTHALIIRLCLTRARLTSYVPASILNVFVDAGATLLKTVNRWK